MINTEAIPMSLVNDDIKLNRNFGKSKSAFFCLFQGWRESNRGQYADRGPARQIECLSSEREGHDCLCRARGRGLGFAGKVAGLRTRSRTGSRAGSRVRELVPGPSQLAAKLEQV